MPSVKPAVGGTNEELGTQADYALSRHVDRWLHHSILGDPSFDTFVHRANNPVHRGNETYKWPVNGSLFEDPVSGDWFLYVGHYADGYDFGPGKPPMTCTVYRSKNKGESWEHLGPIFPPGDFCFEGDTLPMRHAPDVMVVYDAGKYHLAYDWCGQNTTWKNAHKPNRANGEDSGCGYAWSEKPEGPFIRAKRPIARTSEVFMLDRYDRVYGTCLVRRQHDWAAIFLMDRCNEHAWAVFGTTATDPQGPWSAPVPLLFPDTDRFYDGPQEYFPSFTHEGYVYLPATGLAYNRNFQELHRARIEDALNPETWEIYQHGSAWHAEDVSHESYGIWGQTFGGFIDKDRRLHVMFPSRDENGAGTINIATRDWDRPYRERGFHFSAHEGVAFTCLRRSHEEFSLKLCGTLRGEGTLLWGYQGRLAGNWGPCASVFTGYYGLELTKTNGWKLVEVDATGKSRTWAEGSLARAPQSLQLEVSAARTRIQADGAMLWSGQLPLRRGPIGLIASKDTHHLPETPNCPKKAPLPIKEKIAHWEITEFLVSGKSEPATLTFTSDEALWQGTQTHDDWEKRSGDARFRFGQGAVSKNTTPPHRRAKWNFRGTGFTLWSPKGPEFGKISVLLDGEIAAIVNLFSETPQPSAPILSRQNLGAAFHAVVLRPVSGAMPVDTLDVIG